MTNIELLLLPAILILGIAFIIVYIRMRREKNKGDLIIADKRQNTKNRLYGLYKAYMATPVIKRYFSKMKKKYRSIFPADEVTLNTRVTKEMTKCLICALLIFAVVCVVCKGNIPYTIIGGVGAYMIFTMILNSSNDSLEMKLLDQLDTFITDIHAYYHDSHNVEDAIMQTLDDLPYEIGLHADKILTIVTSPESDLEMEKYIQTSPNRFLLLLATICNSIKEYGDKELENGKSLFLTNLNHLKGELNDERIRLTKKRNAFMGVNFAVLIPLFILKPAETLLLKSMTELKEFFDGIGGIISLAIVTTITLICYEVINVLKDDGEDDENEHRFFVKTAGFPGIKGFLTRKINKNYSKSLRLTDKLKATGDTAGLPAFLVKQYLWATMFFLIVTVVVLFGSYKSKKYLLSDFSSAYGQELVPSEEYREDLQRISLDLHGEIRNYDENLNEKVHTFLTEHEYNDEMAEAIIAELKKRHEEYEAYYYKWYYLVIALVASVIGYYIPELLLEYKFHIRKLKREDEVAQFRTVILILMHEDGMMLDTVLEWMERFAKSFKQSLSECIMNLEYSQRDALEELKEKESGFPPFRRLVDSLIATDDVGLEGAFDDLETEREYYHGKRREDSDMIIKKNSSTAKTLMMIPLFSVIGAYIIYPFVMYVVNMLTEFGEVF